jgi:hypothetical protein
MGISFTTRAEGDTLFVKASGFDENLDDVKNFSMAVIEATRKNGAQRVLSDEREVEYRIGTFDTYDLGKFLSENVPSPLRIATVCNPSFISDATFFEDVVVNRGATLRIFTDVDKAKEWLNVQNVQNGTKEI